MTRLRARLGALVLAFVVLALCAASVLAVAAPEAVDDAYETPKDTPLRVTRPGVLENDSDADDDPLTVLAVVAAPAHGSVTLNGDGSFTYTPRNPGSSAGTPSITRPRTASS